MDSGDLAALRDGVRSFCDAHVRPTARDRDRSEAFPAELLPGLVDIGVLGAVIPQEHGGAGLDAAGYRVVVEELGAADSSTARTAGSPVSWCRRRHPATRARSCTASSASGRGTPLNSR